MNAEELIRMHLGNLMVQVAVLQAENEELKQKLTKYEAESKLSREVLNRQS